MVSILLTTASTRTVFAVDVTNVTTELDVCTTNVTDYLLVIHCKGGGACHGTVNTGE